MGRNRNGDVVYVPVRGAPFRKARSAEAESPPVFNRTGREISCRIRLFDTGDRRENGKKNAVPANFGERQIGENEWQLFVPFRPVVGFAQHLAVGNAGSATFAPCGHMVGIHLLEFPYFGAGGIMTESAQRTVGLASSLCRGSLPVINR